MQLKVQIISYDVLIARFIFLPEIQKKIFVQSFTYTQNKHTLSLLIAYQIFVQKPSGEKKNST